jgi:hypothetical protein
MTVFLLTLLREADCLTVTQPETGDGFDFAPAPGQEQRFNLLARKIMGCPGAFSAFSRHDGEGGYRNIQIIPHDDGAFARAVSQGLKPEA